MWQHFNFLRQWFLLPVQVIIGFQANLIISGVFIIINPNLLMPYTTLSKINYFWLVNFNLYPFDWPMTAQLLKRVLSYNPFQWYSNCNDVYWFVNTHNAAFCVTRVFVFQSIFHDLLNHSKACLYLFECICHTYSTIMWFFTHFIHILGLSSANGCRVHILNHESIIKMLEG